MSEEAILGLAGLQAGVPMSEASICEAVGDKPAVVNRQLFNLIMADKIVRKCGVGSSPAMYLLSKNRATE